MRKLSYREALGAAVHEEMRRDPNVVVFCEDAHFPFFPYSQFADEFAPERIPVVPISEEGFTGMAIGAAMTGVRPVVDYTIASLMYEAYDQIMNHAAKNRFLFGGQTSVPVVLLAAMKYANYTAAQHSDRPYPHFMNQPGIKVVIPTNPTDCYGLMKTAIRDNDPVVFLEPLVLWSTKEELPDEEYLIPFGQAAVKREGSDVTVVAIADAVPKAVAAAEELSSSGIDVEVIDPRTLVPLDFATILESVAKTGCLVVADPANRTCSAASEIAATVAEQAFDSLRGPIVRVCTPDVHVPFSWALEADLYPTTAKIAAAVQTLVDRERVSI
jgi:pyruvate dehydrogenase E1 component beta subunit